jgi:hypothetical protein
MIGASHMLCWQGLDMLIGSCYVIRVLMHSRGAGSSLLRLANAAAWSAVRWLLRFAPSDSDLESAGEVWGPRLSR